MGDALSNKVGAVVGTFASPFFGVTSALRRARTFHPVGDCAVGVASVADDVAKLHADLAARLTGPVFVRFSDALTKRKARWPDVLGCAVRFGGQEGDQDLLFATIKRPWTMPFSPLTTHVDDYLANDYFAVSPFEVFRDSTQRFYFRLHPSPSSSMRAQESSPRLRRLRRHSRSRSKKLRGPEQRRARLEYRTINHDAVLILGISTRPWGPFSSLCRIELTGIEDDQPTLRFDPFRAGRGITPVGFVHSLRRSVYAFSQFVRH